MSMDDVPVYTLMTSEDTFQIVLLSVIDSMIANLIELNAGRPYRVSRLHTAHEKIHQVEKNIPGYIPEAYQNSADKFLKFMYADLNSLKKKLPTEDKWAHSKKEK